jgi:predicted permease
LFTLTACATLALGLGATTAIFSLLNAVALRPLPVADARGLVQLKHSIPLWETGGSNDRSLFSYPEFERLRARSDALSGAFAASSVGRVNLNAGGAAGVARAEACSGEFFATLGVVPQHGRLIAPDDDRPGASALVLSDRYWRSRFGADRSVVGGAVRVNQQSFTVIGVAPPEFCGLTPGSCPDVWAPLRALDRLQPDRERWTQAFSSWLTVGGRLRPGVALPQAQAALDGACRRVLAESLPASGLAGRADVERFVRDVRLLVRSSATGFDGSLRDRYTFPLVLLLGVAGLVLLLACANIANLLLARSANRARETAVRLAVGASRGRLVRQHLTESLLLAFLGGALAAPLAWWGSWGLLRLVSTGDGRLPLSLAPDARVFGFAFAACLLTGLLFGLAPAVRATREDAGPALRRSSARAGCGPRKLDRALVVAQVALSVALVAGAGLFARTLRELWRVDVGYDRSSVLMLSVDASLAGYPGERAAVVYGEILSRLRQLPDVTSAAASIVRPRDDQFFLIDRVGEVDGRRLGEQTAVRVAWNAVSPGYFATVSTPLVAGRDFDGRDRESAPAAVIVNQTLATALFGSENAIGHKLAGATVVGVARDARYRGARDPVRPILYLPLAQAASRRAFDWGYVSFELRYRGGTGLLDQARREIAAIDGNLPLFRVRTLAAQAEQSLLKERLMATLSTFFGGLGLLLACVGLSGLMAYAVAGRTAEIGVRMALGARPGEIVRLILLEAAWLTGAGLALGVPLALAVAYSARSLLFGVGPADPQTLTGTVALLAAAALLAGYLPARRALRMDPLTALRCE